MLSNQLKYSKESDETHGNRANTLTKILEKSTELSAQLQTACLLTPPNKEPANVKNAGTKCMIYYYHL